MFGLKFSERTAPKSSHPMADASAAARLVSELPQDMPASAVAEAAAWLESIEAEAFAASHRLHLTSMIDEAVNASVEELTLAYLGAAAGNQGRASDWRVLMSYLDRLGAAYAAIAEDSSALRVPEFAARMPLVLVRAIRAITRSMKISWLRYLPPDRASWEALVRCYRTSRGRGSAKTMVLAYANDSESTSALQEMTVGVMLAAAAPQSLTPRQVELAYRIAAAHRGLFTVNAGHEQHWRHYLFNLDDASPPARLPDQVAAGGDLLFFSAEAVLPQLQPIVERSTSGVAMMADAQFGLEFGATEKLSALEHVLKFWDDSPPARRDERVRINTKIQVEVGGAAIRKALEESSEPELGMGPALTMLELSGESAPAVEANTVAPLNNWLLTDYSTRGIGARFSRRLDRWLKVGSLVGFKLERSEKWCVAIVRRLRTDSRNQTDVGCEILAKSARLVKLEGLASAGTLLDLGGSGPLVRTAAVMLPDDGHLHTRASLLFEPGTNAPGQSFVLHDGDTARRIRLCTVAESMDGWDRVEFDVV